MIGDDDFYLGGYEEFNILDTTKDLGFLSSLSIATGSFNQHMFKKPLCALRETGDTG